jgi:hypothetical protein
MALVVVTQVEKRAQSGAVNRGRPIEGRPLTTPYLTTSEACRRFHVSRGKLSQMRRDGLVHAINAVMIYICHALKMTLYVQYKG